MQCKNKVKAMQEFKFLLLVMSVTIFLHCCCRRLVGDVVILASVVAGLFLSLIPRLSAQQLSPRTFWPAPKGTKVAVAGYSYSFGDVLMDPSIPISGLDSRINTGLLAYMQTFSLAGRTANCLLEQSYSWGTTAGRVFGIPAQSDFSGFDDLGLTLAVNLLGAPTMTPSDFQELRDKPRPILGASVKVLAPTGNYDNDRLINTGANRWAVRPKLGCILPLHSKWLLEVDAGTWFFTDDDDFLAGKREQEPVFALEAHLVKRFKPGFWASLEANYFAGGRQTIGGNRLVDEQNNARIGGTVVVPFLRRHAIKAGYSTSIVTEYGNEFQQALLAYNVAF